MTERRLSRRIERLRPSGIRRMFELMASMDDPINLSIGQAHFPPPEELVEAACRALRDGANGYTVTQGLPSLNARVLEHLQATRATAPDGTIITSGTSGGLVLGFLCLLDEGDRVLLPDPHFVMYRQLAHVCGAGAVYYDTYPDGAGRGAWRPDPAQLAELVDERTRVVVVNSPSNPTGALLQRDDLRALVEAAAEVGAWIVADEIYDAFVYEDFTSILDVADGYDRVLLLGGFSKTYGIAGWRVGWAAGPADLIDRMTMLQQFSFVCAPAPLQAALAEVAFDIDLSPHIDAYRGKRDRLVAGLDDAYELVSPGGSFYAFPRVPSAAADAAALVEAAVAEDLLIVPGTAFSPRDTHFRISFATDDATLERGLDVLNGLARRFA